VECTRTADLFLPVEALVLAAPILVVQFGFDDSIAADRGVGVDDLNVATALEDLWDSSGPFRDCSIAANMSISVVFRAAAICK
jgi:hypothetical protein